MTSGGVAGAVVWWLATYAVHSTVLLGLALLLTWRHVRAEVWRDALWKAAMLGGVMTASLPGMLPVELLEGTVRLEGTAAALNERAWQPTRLQVVASAWLLVVTGLLVRLARQHVQMYHALQARVEVTDPGVRGVLVELCRHTGVAWPVRLSVAPCPTPMALGASEICVPSRFLRDLDADAQRCALAHELAHLARRDPAWQLLAAVVERVFFFQPLNRLARARLRETAEYLADDWAVRHTASAPGLARCLAQVASWLGAPLPAVPGETIAMAHAGSPLNRRIRRLLRAAGAGAGGTPVRA